MKKNPDLPYFFFVYFLQKYKEIAQQTSVKVGILKSRSFKEVILNNTCSRDTVFVWEKIHMQISPYLFQFSGKLAFQEFMPVQYQESSQQFLDKSKCLLVIKSVQKIFAYKQIFLKTQSNYWETLESLLMQNISLNHRVIDY